MRRLIFIYIFCFTVCVTRCSGQKIEDIASQRLTKNEGEVARIETGLYFFTIRDDAGNETKFFAPMVKLGTLNVGEKIQVSYKKTTDGKLKALGIKPIKEKKKRDKKNKQIQSSAIFPFLNDS